MNACHEIDSRLKPLVPMNELIAHAVKWANRRCYRIEIPTPRASIFQALEAFQHGHPRPGIAHLEEDNPGNLVCHTGEMREEAAQRLFKVGVSLYGFGSSEPEIALDCSGFIFINQ